MGTPKISVITPVYGVERYIVRCAESLLSQTQKDIEFIFIDDCTPDNSMVLLENEIKKNNHHIKEMNWTIKLYKMPKNGGLAAARRQGLQLATGDYIIHCDSDDWVEPNMYETMYSRAIAENADVVLCDYFNDNGGGKISVAKAMETDCKGDYFKAALLQKIGASVWNKLVKQNIAKNEHLIYARANMGEDYVLTIQNIYYSTKISYIEIPLYHYFFNENSITKSASEENVFSRFKQSVENMEAVMDFMRGKMIDRKYKDELDRMKYYKRNNLFSIISKRKYFDIWKETFSEINSRLLFNPYLSFREKAKFVMVYLRLTKNTR